MAIGFSEGGADPIRGARLHAAPTGCLARRLMKVLRHLQNHSLGRVRLLPNPDVAPMEVGSLTLPEEGIEIDTTLTFAAFFPSKEWCEQLFTTPGRLTGAVGTPEPVLLWWSCSTGQLAGDSERVARAKTKV